MTSSYVSLQVMPEEEARLVDASLIVMMAEMAFRHSSVFSFIST
jgi:hypothetical protein